MEIPKRKPNRLKDYDYNSNGAYFVTVCTKNKKRILCDVSISPSENTTVGADIIRPQNAQLFATDIINSENTIAEIEIRLSETGELVRTAIESINTYCPYVSVDKYIIMPDHIHILIVINDSDTDGRIISAPTGTNKQRLEVIIGQMKRWVSKQAGFPLWQKSFHDHIIRTQEDYFHVWNYIDSNPRLWLENKDNH